MSNELTIEINADDSGLQEGLSDLKQNLAIVSESLMELGTSIQEAFKGAIEGLFDTQKGLLKFQNQTGATNADMKKYGAEIKDLYKNGWGESIEDVSASMANVQQQSKQLGINSPKDLKNITEQAIILRDNFDVEIPEATKTAGNLMKAFGMTSKESLDYIAKGFQSGLNQSDDFMDTLYEYSPQFAKIGLDANDMFAILKSGSESGIFTLDKIGDAVKEFGIRAMDGSTTSGDAFKAIGLNAEKMTSTFVKGGKDANDAFYQTIDALSKIKDPVKQNAAGVALFGTMWEDLGAKTILAFKDLDKSSVKYKGTMDEIKKNTAAQDIGNQFESIKRVIEIDIVQPIAAKLVPSLKELAKVANEELPKVAEAFKKIPDNVVIATAAIGGLTAIIIPAIGLYGMLTPAIEALSVAFGAIGVFIAGISAPVLIAIGAFAAWLVVIYVFRDEIMSAFNQIASVVIPILTSAFNYLKTTFMTYIMPIIEQQLPKIKSSFMEAFESIRTHLSTVIPFIIQLIDGMKPVFNAIVYVLQGLWTGFLIVFGNIIQFLGSTISNIIQFVKGFIDLLIGIVNIGLGILSGDWGRVWDGIKTTLIGIFNIVKSVVYQAIDIIKVTIGSGLEIVSGIFNRIFPGIGETVRQAWYKIRDYFSTGASSIKETLSGAMNAIPGIISSIGNSIYNAGSKLIDQLVDGIKAGLGKVKSVCKSVGQAISDFFPHSPAKEGPLKTFPKVGLTLMNQLMDGIYASQNKLSNLTANVASNISENVNVNDGTGNQSNNSNNLIIPIYLDGKKISEVATPYMVRALRQQGY
jgi:phage-related minor tail protein